MSDLAQAKMLLSRAMDTRHKLRAKLAASQKQAKWGNEQTAAIHAGMISGLERKLAEAEELYARSLQAKESIENAMRERASEFQTATVDLSKPEFAIPGDLSIPLFLRRAQTSQPDPVG